MEWPAGVAHSHAEDRGLVRRVVATRHVGSILSVVAHQSFCGRELAERGIPAGLRKCDVENAARIVWAETLRRLRQTVVMRRYIEASPILAVPRRPDRQRGPAARHKHNSVVFQRDCTRPGREHSAWCQPQPPRQPAIGARADDKRGLHDSSRAHGRAYGTAPPMRAVCTVPASTSVGAVTAHDADRCPVVWQQSHSVFVRTFCRVSNLFVDRRLVRHYSSELERRPVVRRRVSHDAGVATLSPAWASGAVVRPGTTAWPQPTVPVARREPGLAESCDVAV